RAWGSRHGGSAQRAEIAAQETDGAGIGNLENEAVSVECEASRRRGIDERRTTSPETPGGRALQGYRRGMRVSRPGQRTQQDGRAHRERLQGRVDSPKRRSRVRHTTLDRASRGPPRLLSKTPLKSMEYDLRAD